VIHKTVSEPLPYPSIQIHSAHSWICPSCLLYLLTGNPRHGNVKYLFPSKDWLVKCASERQSQHPRDGRAHGLWQFVKLPWHTRINSHPEAKGKHICYLPLCQPWRMGRICWQPVFTLSFDFRL